MLYYIYIVWEKAMMSDNRLSFEQIISTISDAEMMASYPRKNRADLDTDNQQQISPEKQRFYLAFYAKAAYEHVGFGNFSQQNQENFKAQIENLYANINGDRQQGEFLHDLVAKNCAIYRRQTFSNRYWQPNISWWWRKASKKRR